MDDPTRPMAAACPDLVHADDLRALARELPRISPERLWFLTEDDKQIPRPEVAARMPNGDQVFAWQGTIYAMSEDDWMHYDGMRRAA